ncbi:hypothetical protein HYH03_018867 [Edaphochlamys debaryana]|uniref:Uncharacterized protein n=1 Tax=Edaphochlamys debaryana TaxID=47281 RepID=A0A836BMI6_9CHLO|nr:hypothetical protein HYH03_018867 [Edaphochlamys debaryana]|eukprot:KAG2482186.1 hypothetical protein HYH03_018867 [Edaphochlamys debaryana]
MAYNLYQVQMARAWAERIDKEVATAEKFWHQQSMKSASQPGSPHGRPNIASAADGYYSDDVRSNAGSAVTRSAAPTGFTSKTTYLKTRMEKLEAELQAERENRKKVEQDLLLIKNSLKRG